MASFGLMNVIVALEVANGGLRPAPVNRDYGQEWVEYVEIMNNCWEEEPTSRYRYL